MRRGSARRFPSARLFAIANGVAIVLLYAYVQWRIDKATSTAVLLGGAQLDVSLFHLAAECVSKAPAI